MQNVVGKNIRRIRKQKKMTQKQLSERTGFSQNGISNHESGNRKIDELDIMIYAEALGVKPHELFNEEAAEEESIPTVSVQSVPIVDQFSPESYRFFPGGLSHIRETATEYTTFPEDVAKEGKDYFGFIVRDDSMDKEFREGDVVVIEKDGKVEDGQIGLVLASKNVAELRRIRYNKGALLLIPESNNPAYQPEVYTNQNDVHIIGRVVSLSRRY